MDGILIIDKPAGITSHDVVSRVRRTLKTRRVGHTGTLDPFATGVMVILVGRATRLAQFLDKDEKEYEAVVQFGHETDTGDLTGVWSAECGVRNEEIEDILRNTDLDALLEQFRGEIDQVPPMFSAKKVSGRKLYEHAREGDTIERRPVKVRISHLEILNDKRFRIPHSAFRIRIVCSAGTYIRQLAEDIGRKVGVGAHLTELRRTRAGRFRLSDALTLDKLAEAEDPISCLRPVDAAVEHLPAITLTPDRVEKTRNGLSTRVETAFEPGTAVQMRDDKGELIAIGVFDDAENSIRPKVVLI